MLVGSVPFSLLGVTLGWWLTKEYGDAFEDEAKKILGFALIVCGIAFLIRAYTRYKASNAPFLLRNRDRVVAVAVGVFGGFMVGLTSVGSGTVFGLVMIGGIPPHRGEDRRHRHLPRRHPARGGGRRPSGRRERRHGGDRMAADRLDPGVLLGRRVTVKLPDRSLRIALAATLTLAGVKLLEPPGDDIVVVVGAALAAVWAVVAGARWLAARNAAPAAPEAQPASVGSSDGGSGQATNVRPVNR